MEVSLSAESISTLRQLFDFDIWRKAMIKTFAEVLDNAITEQTTDDVSDNTILFKID